MKHNLDIKQEQNCIKIDVCKTLSISDVKAFTELLNRDTDTYSAMKISYHDLDSYSSLDISALLLLIEHCVTHKCNMEVHNLPEDFMLFFDVALNDHDMQRIQFINGPKLTPSF